MKDADQELRARAARSARMTVVGVPPEGDPLDADLIVPRLDDERVFDLLGIVKIADGAPVATVPHQRTGA